MISSLVLGDPLYLWTQLFFVKKFGPPFSFGKNVLRGYADNEKTDNKKSGLRERAMGIIIMSSA